MRKYLDRGIFPLRNLVSVARERSGGVYIYSLGLMSPSESQIPCTATKNALADIINYLGKHIYLLIDSGDVRHSSSRCRSEAVSLGWIHVNGRTTYWKQWRITSLMMA
jgi:hypothetical protein